MIEAIESPQTMSISEFKARCTERLRAVEEQGITLKITRHGKVVATVTPATSGKPSMETWIGSGVAVMGDTAEELFDGPTWEPGVWDMESDNPL